MTKTNDVNYVLSIYLTDHKLTVYIGSVYIIQLYVHVIVWWGILGEAVLIMLTLYFVENANTAIN